MDSKKKFIGVEWASYEECICREGLFEGEKMVNGNIIHSRDYELSSSTLIKENGKQGGKNLRFNINLLNIGLDKENVIQKDKNGIVSLQGELFTNDEKQIIKNYVKNTKVEELDKNPELVTLYYSIIMDKKQYPDINILMPDNNVK